MFWAGVPGKGQDCTLIVTEGESAKALAVAGLEVVGRETYGVIALRGKVLNVSSKRKDPFKSKEIVNLCQALGLNYSKSYKSTSDLSSLRYGHIMLMTDQDADGNHIKALVINVIHTFWPQLLEREGFMQQFHTPMVKAFQGPPGKAKVVREFYSTSEYDEWVRELQQTEKTQKLLKSYTIKYYKVLVGAYVFSRRALSMLVASKSCLYSLRK